MRLEISLATGQMHAAQHNTILNSEILIHCAFFLLPQTVHSIKTVALLFIYIFLFFRITFSVAIKWWFIPSNSNACDCVYLFISLLTSNDFSVISCVSVWYIFYAIVFFSIALRNIFLNELTLCLLVGSHLPSSAQVRDILEYSWERDIDWERDQLLSYCSGQPTWHKVNEWNIFAITTIYCSFHMFFSSCLCVFYGFVFCWPWRRLWIMPLFFLLLISVCEQEALEWTMDECRLYMLTRSVHCSMFPSNVLHNKNRIQVASERL